MTSMHSFWGAPKPACRPFSEDRTVGLSAPRTPRRYFWSKEGAGTLFLLTENTAAGGT